MKACMECGSTLPQSRRKFCSDGCCTKYQERKKHEARMLAKRGPMRKCAVCGRRKIRLGLCRFCSFKCMGLWPRSMEGRLCPECGRRLPQGCRTSQVFCSRRCSSKKTSRKWYHEEKARNPEFIVLHRDRLKRLRDHRVSRGLCAQCSVPLEVGEVRYCATCRSRSTEWRVMNGY